MLVFQGTILAFGLPVRLLNTNIPHEIGMISFGE